MWATSLPSNPITSKHNILHFTVSRYWDLESGLSRCFWSRLFCKVVKEVSAGASELLSSKCLLGMEDAFHCGFLLDSQWVGRRRKRRKGKEGRGEEGRGEEERRDRWYITYYDPVFNILSTIFWLYIQVLVWLYNGDKMKWIPPFAKMHILKASIF